MEKFFPFAWCVMGKNCQPVDTSPSKILLALKKSTLPRGLLTIGSMAVLGTPPTPVEWGELSDFAIRQLWVCILIWPFHSFIHTENIS